MYSLDLQWASFKVDLPSIETFVKANQGSASYVGNSADADLTLWFNNDPTIQPTSPQTQTVTPAVSAIAASLTLGSDTLTAETAGTAGNARLTADGTTDLADLVTAWNAANPSNEIALTGAGTQVPAAGPLTLTGGADAIAAVATVTDVVQVASGPSPASVIQAYWAALSTSSPEALAYTANKTAAQYAAIASAAIDFGNAMVVQFAGQNLQLGITQAGMTKTVRQAMQEVTDCLSTGSLIEAIAEIKAIPTASYDPTFITAARLLAACNQLEKFCGLTLSTSLS